VFVEAAVGDGFDVGVAKGVGSRSTVELLDSVFFADIDQHPTAAAARPTVNSLRRSI